MNKKILTTLAVVVVIGTGLVVARPADAFWPFDWFKKNFDSQESVNSPKPKGLFARFKNMDPEKKEEFRLKRQEFRQEAHEALAEFLGLSVDELEERIQNGETPKDIAQDLGLDIEQFHEQRKDLMIEHMKEIGLTDEQIEKMQEWYKSHKSFCHGMFKGHRPFGARFRGQDADAQ